MTDFNKEEREAEYYLLLTCQSYDNEEESVLRRAAKALTDRDETMHELQVERDEARKNCKELAHGLKSTLFMINMMETIIRRYEQDFTTGDTLDEIRSLVEEVEGYE